MRLNLEYRFVGGAFDGAYIRNNIKEHLLAEFGIPEEHSDAYAFHWDPAHMIGTIPCTVTVVCSKISPAVDYRFLVLTPVCLQDQKQLHCMHTGLH